MNKLLIATAAVATLGLTAAANAQTYYRTAPGPSAQYYEPGPNQGVMVEGRNSTMMVSPDEAQRYVPESYSRGGYLGPSPYVNNPGVEPYIAKQIEQDQRGD
jgi:hypothetical protein